MTGKRRVSTGEYDIVPEVAAALVDLVSQHPEYHISRLPTPYPSVSIVGSIQTVCHIRLGDEETRDVEFVDKKFKKIPEFAPVIAALKRHGYMEE